MKKVILNKCFGGFGVSLEVYKLYAQAIGKKAYFYRLCDDLTYKRIYDPTCYDFCFLKCFGGFPKDEDLDNKYLLYIDERYRENKKLIKIIEKLKGKANSFASDLRIVEIPDDLDYTIDNYNGMETLFLKNKKGERL